MLMQSKDTYKVFPFLIMLYLTFSISSMVLAYKVIDIFGITITGSALMLPFRYLFGDIIAEVYGYYVAKRIIVYLIVCWFVFSLTTIAVIHLPSPVSWDYTQAFDLVLGKTINTVSATFFAVMIGSNFNIYIITKLKILARGKMFWLRGVASSVVGELIQYSIALPIVYFNIMPIKKIIPLIIFDFTTQIILLLIISLPANFILLIVKRIENIDSYDDHIRFNPFILSPPNKYCVGK